MNTNREQHPVDYLGVIGKDPKSDPEIAKAWRELRDQFVHGPRLEFTFATKPRMWPWQSFTIRSVWRMENPAFDNWPKGGGKTEVMKRMFETGEQMNMHAYMNYPGLWNDERLDERLKDFDKINGEWPMKNHQRESLAEMAKRFADSIPEYKGHRKNNVPILTGFRSLNTMLNGGIPLGSWYNQPMHVPMEIRAKVSRNWPIQALGSEALMEAYAKAMEGRVFIDLEGDLDIEATMKRLHRHVDGFVIDSVPNMRGSSERQLHAFDYKMGQYLYNPLDRLTQLYEKARKKFKHKDAVNYLVKREKHGRKWVAKQLEEIGAAFENKKLEELRAKAKKEAAEKWEKQYGDCMSIPDYPLSEYKQFAGRIDRTPKESEE